MEQRKRLDDMPEFLTVEEVADYLRMGRTSAYTAVKCGDIPSVRIGRLYRIPKDELLKRLRPA